MRELARHDDGPSVSCFQDVPAARVSLGKQAPRIAADTVRSTLRVVSELSSLVRAKCSMH